MQVGVGVLECVEAVLERHQDADVIGCTRATHVLADERCEVATGAGHQLLLERDGERQRPHGLGDRLLLPADGEHPLVHAGLHVAGRDDGRGAAHRAGGVHPEQRLADRSQRLGQVRLGHHDALEEVGGLAHHDGVDVVHRQVRVRRAPGRRPRAATRAATRRPGPPSTGSGRHRRRPHDCALITHPPGPQPGSAATGGRWWHGPHHGRRLPP